METQSDSLERCAVSEIRRRANPRRARASDPRTAGASGARRGSRVRPGELDGVAARTLAGCPAERRRQLAARCSSERDAISFNRVDSGDAGATPSEPVDLLFANAVFHWLPDHATLLPSLMEKVRKGGVLAVQMPLSSQEPSHRLMREVRARVMPGRQEVKGDAGRERGVLLRPAGAARDDRRHLANHLRARDARRRRHRRVGQGDRSSTLPRRSDRQRACGLPRRLSDGDRSRLSTAGRRQTALFIPASVHRRRSLRAVSAVR